jgi:hypothetical protein
MTDLMIGGREATGLSPSMVPLRVLATRVIVLPTEVESFVTRYLSVTL